MASNEVTGGARPLRFGVVAPLRTKLPAWRDQVRRIADSGFSTLLMPDVQQWQPAPGPTLAVAATLADLRVGTWVYASPLRTPRSMAWEAHSLSVLTEGRFEMGIGAGRPGIEDELRELGLPVVTPGERLSRVHDAVTFGDAHMMLDAQSALTIAPKAVTLEYGGAWFEVAPRGDRAPFVVIAGDLNVKVIGTKFRVARSAEHVEVGVDHGTVEVHYQGKLTTLHDHEQWASDDLSTLATPNATTPSEADYEAVAQHETIHGYLELAHGQGRWAEVAFYAAARLAADQHDVRASALLELYLRRFPSGANATDARQLLTRLKGE